MTQQSRVPNRMQASDATCGGLAALVSLLGLTACAGNPNYPDPETVGAADDNLIVACKRVGRVYFGMPFEEVFRTLGKPNEVRYHEEGGAYYRYGGLTLGAWHAPFKSVDRITVSCQAMPERYSTAEGARCGMTEWDLRQIYGDPTFRSESPRVLRVSFPGYGFSFWKDGGGEFIEVGVDSSGC